MRVRTAAKREAILETAAEVFLALGYERASMSEIAARLGGSKATLYSYFTSKEELFLAVAEYKVGSLIEPAFQELPTLGDEEPRALLTRLGERITAATLTPEAIALRRTVIAQATLSEVGQRFWKFGPQQAFDAMAAYLAAATKAGRLNVKDPQVAAQQILALYGVELEWRWLFGFQQSFTRQQIKQVVARAVDMFMAAYGPQKMAG
ncbi:MAG TPA: TetR/AcrR family transcriptional regulator [Burkholderiaceae bacterium]|nr:TetR/AcrR family transcriptional regulator [Burkholderiaceae bacterium]